MGFVLFIVAFILTAFVSVLSVIITPIYYIVNLDWKGGFKQLNYWFLMLAVSIDQFGNVSCAKVLQLTMTKSPDAHPFGNEDDTVSYVLGRNKYKNNLTNFGKFIVWVLHVIDRNHVEKAIESKIKSDQEANKRLKDNYYG